MAPTTEFFGETFTLSTEVSQFALLEFAAAAADGQDSDSMEGLASMYRLVKDCIAEEDLARFLVVARKNKATTAELIPVLTATFEGQASEDTVDLPTGRPADSSTGPQLTKPKSASSAAAKASQRLAGRPDLQVAASRAS